MYEDESVTVYELRRRRLLGGIAVGVIALVVYALNGWQVKPIWSLFSVREGTFAAGDPYNEWIYAVCDGEVQQVTVLRDGHIEGVSALGSLRSIRFPNWCGSLPAVDNPALADWQAQLDDFQALTAEATSAGPIFDAAERLPVSALYLKPMAEWLRDEAHAHSFLDTVAERPMHFDHPDRAIMRARQANFARLTGNALDIVMRGEVTPAELERWLASAQIAGSDQAMVKLASLGDVSVDAGVMVLKRLEAVPYSQRTSVYLAVAPNLVDRSESAGLLRDKLMLLPPGDRPKAAVQLLALSDRNVDVPIALLSTLERGLGGSEAKLQLFTAIADRIRDEPDAPVLLARHLDDLGPIERRLGAQHLIGLDRAGDTAFTLSVLGTFGDLHPLSQPKLIYSLMQSSPFTDRSVQAACLLAIQLQVRGPTRSELLEAMARHPALDDNLKAQIRLDLASSGLAHSRAATL